MLACLELLSSSELLNHVNSLPGIVRFRIRIPSPKPGLVYIVHDVSHRLVP